VVISKEYFIEITPEEVLKMAGSIAFILI